MSLLAIVPYPRGFLLTRQQNTWSCLYFKWMALRFHSHVGGVGGEAFAFFCFPVFPPNLGKVHSVPAERHRKPNTTYPFNSGSLDHSTQGGLSFRSQVCSNMYLKVLPNIYISVSTSWNWVLLLLYRWSGIQNSQPLVCFSIAGVGYDAMWLRCHAFPRNKHSNNGLCPMTCFFCCPRPFEALLASKTFTMDQILLLHWCLIEKKAALFVKKVTFSLKGWSAGLY